MSEETLGTHWISGNKYIVLGRFDWENDEDHCVGIDVIRNGRSIGLYDGKTFYNRETGQQEVSELGLKAWLSENGASGVEFTEQDEIRLEIEEALVQLEHREQRFKWDEEQVMRAREALPRAMEMAKEALQRNEAEMARSKESRDVMAMMIAALQQQLTK